MAFGIGTALISIFGKPVADRLIKGLGERKDGAQRLEEAAAAMAQGISAIEALKKAFGKEFFSTLNDVLGAGQNSRFSYEAGTQSYIQLPDDGSVTVEILRDELNINLDRLTALNAKNADLKNQFKGLMTKWQKRCNSSFGTKHGDDINTTFLSINSILNGDARNYRDVYGLLKSTGLGGVGALMVIAGVLTATGTGVGIVAAISMFIGGIPWLTVGALVLPGALMMLLAAKKTKPADELSIAVAMAYRLIDRLSGK
jgi:hypothetical protein